jgi:general secretion pathway protein M
MIMPTGNRQSQVLAIGLLVITCVVLFAVVVQPWRDFRAAQQEYTADLRFQLGRYQQLAERQEEFEAALQSIKSRNGGARYYLAQSKPALASAELEQYLERILRSGNAQIMSTQAVSEAGGGVTPSVAVKVRMRSDLMTLVTLIHRVETGSPTLFVNNLTISAFAAGQLNNPAVQVQSLDVQFDLVGFLRDAT